MDLIQVPPPNVPVSNVQPIFAPPVTNLGNGPSTAQVSGGAASLPTTSFSGPPPPQQQNIVVENGLPHEIVAATSGQSAGESAPTEPPASSCKQRTEPEPAPGRGDLAAFSAPVHLPAPASLAAAAASSTLVAPPSFPSATAQPASSMGGPAFAAQLPFPPPIPGTGSAPTTGRSPRPFGSTAFGFLPVTVAVERDRSVFRTEFSGSDSDEHVRRDELRSVCDRFGQWRFPAATSARFPDAAAE